MPARHIHETDQNPQQEKTATDLDRTDFKPFLFNPDDRQKKENEEKINNAFGIGNDQERRRENDKIGNTVDIASKMPGR